MINRASIKSRKIKWGIAGCGRFTEEAFIPALTLSRKGKLVSVHSRDINRAKSLTEKFGVQSFSSDYDEFLKSDMDIVYISSENSRHHEQVIKAAKAGKHILCEKPLAVNTIQAEEMVRVCKENNVHLAVNYVHRFHPLVVKAKELIKDQKLGKLVSISANFNIDFPPSSNFRFNKELSGGGALRDIGTHMIDLLRFLGGEISEIDGVIDNLVYQSEVDDFAMGTIKFVNSGYGIFNVSFNSKKAFNRVEIICHKGAMSIENLIGRRLFAPKLNILFEGEAKKAFRKRGNKQLYLLKSIHKSLLRNETPLITGEDGLINMKLMEELERKCLSKKN
ncbi:MAG TPA: Gfo/Idh/MocA family oxidoreductase [Ignavibacteriaceae bacterium]|nr:Gfo/Idh/MocA family oxidoreductase [Ignavibacteriaceae bacterium]